MNEVFKKTDWRSGIFFLCLGLIVCFFSIRLGPGTLSKPGPGFMPLTAGIVLTFLSFLLLLVQIFIKEAKASWDTKIAIRNVIVVLGGMWAYAFLLEKIGFVFVTFVLVTLLVRFVDPQSWTKSLIVGAAASGLSFLFFDTLLKTQLPRTFLGFF